MSEKTGKGNEISKLKVSAEMYGGAINTIALNILKTRMKTSSNQKALGVGTLGFDLDSLKDEDRKEQKMTGDFTHFALNNSDAFIHFCESTLASKFQPEDFTKDFLFELRRFFIMYGTNFTNYIISFYLENHDLFHAIQETSKLTEDFKCNTDLMTIRQSNNVTVYKGELKGEVKKGYIAFSIDLTKDVDTILDYMLNKPLKENLFKVHMSRLDYFRDLGNNFFAFNNFYEHIKIQFIENILNQTNALLVEVVHDKVYFLAKTDAVPVLNFKIYGIPFEQTFKIELVGE
ncbi:hypothetical protein [Bacillus toyonensis]|uniref:hypothetical protein n=1 Tax=Bacillus toyonensis TaxID=155322 RepID=UPI000BF6B401|nr:hypothetical protein [Bacillus toyonensis]PGF05257.1 hypothetical protein COM61_02265 [Bacillus toyonensis]